MAIRDGSGSVSYRVMPARVDAIAALLTSRGLQPEQPVGVLMSRTADLIAVLLGILQAGGCYVPLDPDDPPERNRRILSGAACELVLGQATLLEPFRAHLQDSTKRATLISVEPGCGLPANNAGTPANHVSAPGGKRLAYILFTSGSTGAPKGVEVEHRSVVNLLLAMRDWFAFSESDRYLAISTLGFDISVAEIFLPLITGATMVLRDRKLLMEPRRLAEEIRSEGVTVFQTGPSVWSILLDEVADFPKVRVAITTRGGDPARTRAPARRPGRSRLESLRTHGDHGLGHWTPAGPGCPSIASSSKVSAPIGLAPPNVAARVLDEQQQPVAPGVEGELWIGGDAVAWGYCRNPELTWERFQILGATGGRFYRTGDVVLQDAQGVLHYFGRNDDQIKVRGGAQRTDGGRVRAPYTSVHFPGRCGLV